MACKCSLFHHIIGSNNQLALGSEKEIGAQIFANHFDLYPFLRLLISATSSISATSFIPATFLSSSLFYVHLTFLYLFV
ncbi:hypothetical protein CPB83DRAFT_900249 [Crepidotus variabilis]|uniref:Uncharacterized protein n=1 Tax=Crepidotus variabilis TaxID=179855 RepID=A0A9P6E3J0_9AGAR|nr:hypothetical protein CPB83DRAFT_900249 [Crepidotus variabilis]